MDKVFISVDRDGWTNALQLSIDLERPDGGGHGYRLAGPKFNGSSKRVMRHQISERDAREIKGYLDAILSLPGSSRDEVLEEAALLCDQMGAGEQLNYGLGRGAQNYFRARNAIRALKSGVAK